MFHVTPTTKFGNQGNHGNRKNSGSFRNQSIHRVYFRVHMKHALYFLVCQTCIVLMDIIRSPNCQLLWQSVRLEAVERTDATNWLFGFQQWFTGLLRKISTLQLPGVLFGFLLLIKEVNFLKKKKNSLNCVKLIFLTGR